MRDIVQGLVLALERPEAVGQEFTLAGALFDWGELVPYLSERYSVPYLEARIPPPNYFAFDLSKIKRLLGYQPHHDFYSILATAALAPHHGSKGFSLRGAEKTIAD